MHESYGNIVAYPLKIYAVPTRAGELTSFSRSLADINIDASRKSRNPEALRGLRDLSSSVVSCSSEFWLRDEASRPALAGSLAVGLSGVPATTIVVTVRSSIVLPMATGGRVMLPPLQTLTT